MTESEIDSLLQDAIDIFFNSNRMILLIFPNEHESEASYKAVIDFFGQNEVVLKFKIKENRLTLFIVNNENKFVHSGELEYVEKNFNEFIEIGEEWKPKIFFIYNNYNTATGDGLPVMLPVTKQQFNTLNILSCEMLS